MDIQTADSIHLSMIRSIVNRYERPAASGDTFTDGMNAGMALAYEIIATYMGEDA